MLGYKTGCTVIICCLFFSTGFNWDQIVSETSSLVPQGSFHPQKISPTYMCTKLYLYSIYQSFFVNIYVFYPQVQMFFKSIKEQALQLRATQLALDNMQKNIRWYETNIDTLRTWLDGQMNWSQGGQTLRVWGCFFNLRNHVLNSCIDIKQ